MCNGIQDIHIFITHLNFYFIYTATDHSISEFTIKFLKKVNYATFIVIDSHQHRQYKKATFCLECFMTSPVMTNTDDSMLRHLLNHSSQEDYKQLTRND